MWLCTFFFVKALDGLKFNFKTKHHDENLKSEGGSKGNFLDKPKRKIIFHVFPVAPRFARCPCPRALCREEPKNFSKSQRNSEFFQVPKHTIWRLIYRGARNFQPAMVFIKRKTQNFPKSQGQYMRGEFWIFPSPRAYKTILTRPLYKGRASSKPYIEARAQNFSKFWGKARNFSKSKSLYKG